MRYILQHYLNPLHIMCRLIDLGISRRTAITICRKYEILYNPVMRSHVCQKSFMNNV